MEIGRNYLATMRYIERNQQIISDYISSQKENGYLLLETSPDIDKNVIVFSMGQNKFALQIISLHHKKSILYRTYRVTAFPAASVSHIDDMDIFYENNMMTYKVPKEYKWLNHTQTFNTVHDFNQEYFYFLEQYICTLYQTE